MAKGFLGDNDGGDDLVVKPANVSLQMRRYSPTDPQFLKHTIEMVREEIGKDGKKIVIRANLPVGRGWNQGNGALDWKNIAGWIPAEQYDAEQHQLEVAAKKEKQNAKA